MQYLAGAIQWCDETFNGEWSNTIERFDHALSRSIATRNFELCKRESMIYRNSILDMIKKFRVQHPVDEVDTFIKGLR